MAEPGEPSPTGSAERRAALRRLLREIDLLSRTELWAELRASAEERRKRECPKCGAEWAHDRLGRPYCPRANEHPGTRTAAA